MIPIGIVTDTDRSMIQSSVYNLFTITTTVTGITKHILLLPAANEVWGKVICLYLSVILFTGGTWAGTPWAGTPLAGTPPMGRCTLQAGTPSRQVHPRGRYSPPRSGTLPGRYTSQAGIPPGNVCWDTVNKREVSILLECILVTKMHFPNCLVIKRWMWNKEIFKKNPIVNKVNKIVSSTLP